MRFRFTIRELLWFTAFVAVIVALTLRFWKIERRYADAQQQYDAAVAKHEAGLSIDMDVCANRSCCTWPSAIAGSTAAKLYSTMSIDLKVSKNAWKVEFPSRCIVTLALASRPSKLFATSALCASGLRKGTFEPWYLKRGIVEGRQTAWSCRN